MKYFIQFLQSNYSRVERRCVYDMKYIRLVRVNLTRSEKVGGTNHLKHKLDVIKYNYGLALIPRLVL